MAKFIVSKDYEVRETINLPAIEALRKVASNVSAYSEKLRHPRYINKFSKPTFVVKFSLHGKRYFEIEDSLEDLSQVIESTYLNNAVHSEPV